MKKIYLSAGYNTTFMGKGRAEFKPKEARRPFIEYLEEVSSGIKALVPNFSIDEGVIGSFMSPRFINQAHLAGFLPHMFEELDGKMCVAVEGACSTGGRALGTAIRSVLSGMSEVSCAVGFEMQTSVKAIYGADYLAGASYYEKERKSGGAHFFPEIFNRRAEAYAKVHGIQVMKEAFKVWVNQAMENAQQFPKAQQQLPYTWKEVPFLSHLGAQDCSKVSDGASGILVFSEEGRERLGIKKEQCVELLGMGEAERSIVAPPKDLTRFTTMEKAVKKALAGRDLNDLGMLEIHDCFSISALLSIEAIGLAKVGAGAILDGIDLPINRSGGLIGFGHPTGATGVRQAVDIWEALTEEKVNKPAGMMVNMGGDDVTSSCYLFGNP